MHNISTIYRFYTPFLDIWDEKKNLLWVMKKIEKSLSFDWIKFTKIKNNIDKYIKFSIVFEDGMWKIDFYYIKSLKTDEYYLPIFKCDIYLNNKFLYNNEAKKRTVLFLNNIHECYDWLSEKEYLIDLDNSLSYKEWFLSFRKYPNHDFRNLDEIRKKFESNWWVKILENFIIRLKSWNFFLTRNNSWKYHTFYWMLLYFLYLVYIMNLNVIKTWNTISELEDLWDMQQNNWHINLLKKRLKIVDDLNMITYKKYKEKLDLFFNLLN